MLLTDSVHELLSLLLLFAKLLLFVTVFEEHVLVTLVVIIDDFIGSSL